MKQKVLTLLFLFSGLFMQTVYSQITVTGTVTDAQDNSVLPGANIIEKGTSNVAVSDVNGNYTIQLSDENAVLEFSFIGYANQEVPLNGQTTIDVSLSDSAANIDQVVVTALAIEKETKALGYSLTQVGGEELSAVKMPNAINALQGKIAGVNVTQNATGAAGSSRVVIRGASSLNGNNQPLYVIDGIPIDNTNNGSAGLWGGSDGGDGISNLNADEVESVSVLKGGAAAALYGSRASNGVIMITTKSGKRQKGLGVEVNSSITFDNVDTSLQDFQTEYGQGLRGVRPANQSEALDAGLSSWGERFDGVGTVQWDGETRPYSHQGNNIDNYYRGGTTFINSVAISNATGDMNYRFSATDLNNEDIIPNAGLNRKTIGLNAGVKLSNRLTSNVNIKYSIDDVQNRPRLSDAPGNGNFTVANLPGNLDVRRMNPGVNEDLTERQYSNNPFSQNPYFAAFNFRNEDEKNRIIASSSLQYDITDWLYLRGRAGVDNYTVRRTSVEPFGTGYKPLGGINEEEIRYTQIDADLIAGADRPLTDKIGLSAFVGANSNHIKNENLRLSGNNFIVPGLEDISNTIDQSRSRGFGERKIGSLYGSVEFSYNEFLYLTATGRNDWFSTLSFPGKDTPNDQFYNSVNASFVLSDAYELPNNISFLKLRAGYSEVAGGAQTPYQLALTYQIFGQGHQGQPLGNISNSAVPNGNLIPFGKSEFEAGIDARFFNDRLSLDFALYNNETTQDIVPVEASVFSGFGRAIANIGVIENKGVELLLSGTPIKNENLRWDATFNIANNRSEVIGTNESDTPIGLGEPRTRNIDVRQIVGQPFGTLFGVSYERDNGGNIIYDIDGDGVPIARRGARKILGEGVPPLALGFSNSVSYKGLSLYFLIDGKFGGQTFSGTNSVTYGNGLHSETLAGRENGLSVTGIDGATGSSFTTTVAPENLSSYYGRISSIAEQFVQDSDFIKFRQLSLGHKLPQSLIGKSFVKDANLSFIASNLFYLSRSIDNIDPESAYNVGNAQGLEYFGLPSTRSYGLNLNVKF